MDENDKRTYHVLFEIVADNAEQAHSMVSEWTVTPGTTLMGINAVTTYVMAGPVPIDSGNVSEHIPPYGVQPSPPEQDLSPIAMFTANPNPVARNDPVTFDASESTDVVAYAWDFGDGTFETTGPIVEHRYWQTGEFSVTLTVTGAERTGGAPGLQSLATNMQTVAE